MNHLRSRTFQSLRLSLGSACNLACSYCVGPGGPPRSIGELNPKDLARLAGLLYQALDLKKIRFTGGEPLLGNRLELLIEHLGPLDGLDLGLTTNGQLLKDKLGLLRRSGITRINVSLDSLKPERFARMTQGGKLEKTLEGIQAALDQGFCLKLNMVPQKGLNEDEIAPMLQFALERGMELRYIELMRMGHLSQEENFRKLFFPLAEILQTLKKDWDFTPEPRAWGSTAGTYQVESGGRFGVIANESAPFCSHCDRLRLSPKGELVGCLSSEKRYDLKPLLEMEPKEALARLPQILQLAMAEKREFKFAGSGLWMKEVGG